MRIPSDLRKLGYVDPVVQVERDAYRRGRNRGVLESAVALFIVILLLAAMA